MKSVSVVVPLYNEEESIPHLYKELTDVMQPLGCEYELLFIDDGSSDGTIDRLIEIAGEDPHLHLIEFRRNFGQTAAMAAGLEHSSGDIVITMDGDLQNDPAEIPRMIAKLEEGYDLVAGWRKDRKDKFLSRRLPSITANWIISKSTRVHLHDYGCTLKVMNGEIAREIKLYGEMHRFIPALADERGARITEMAVNHRERKYGTSKYGISRTVRVILDLLAVKFLLGYSKRPIHFFGTFGLGTVGFGGLILAYLSFQKFMLGYPIGNRPLLSFGVMFTLVGFQLLMFGLLAEVMARTYHESQEKKTYVVRNIRRGAQAVQSDVRFLEAQGS